MSGFLNTFDSFKLAKLHLPCQVTLMRGSTKSIPIPMDRRPADFRLVKPDSFFRAVMKKGPRIAIPRCITSGLSLYLCISQLRLPYIEMLITDAILISFDQEVRSSFQACR